MRPLPVLLLASSLATSGIGCVRREALPSTAPLEAPPPGQFELKIVSDDPGQTWDVITQDRGLVCSTPCLERLPSAEAFLLLPRRGDGVEVPPMGVVAPGARHAVIVAERTHRGKQVNGIVWTSFGGMGAVVAITLSAVGCSDLARRAGMCTAGLVTGGVSLPLTALGLWLLIDSAPKAHVLPVLETEATPGHAPVTLTVTPTGLAGSF